MSYLKIFVVAKLEFHHQDKLATVKVCGTKILLLKSHFDFIFNISFHHTEQKQGHSAEMNIMSAAFVTRFHAHLQTVGMQQLENMRVSDL